MSMLDDFSTVFLEDSALGDSRLPIGPIELAILQPTPFCNLDCSYCYLPDRLSRDRMRFPVLERALFFLLSNELATKNLTVTWHAGEPLVVGRDFYEHAMELCVNTIAEGAVPVQSVKHSIQTNGTLIDQGWCDLFRRHSVHVGLSLDGPEDLHNRNRMTRDRKGTFSEVMSGLKLLVCNEVEFSIITVLNEHTLDDPDRLYNFYSENSIRSVGFNIEEITGANQTSPFTLGELEQKFANFMRRMLLLAAQDPAGFEIREFRRFKKTILGDGGGAFNQLNRPFAILSIDHNGNFSTFCPELLTTPSIHDRSRFVLGNVMNDSLASAVRSDRFRALFLEIYSGLLQCKLKCGYFGLCKGGAPSNKFFEKGTFDCAETTFCRFTRQRVIDVVLEHLEQQPAASQAGV